MDDLSGAIQGFSPQPGAMEQLQQMAQQLGLSPQNPPENQEKTKSGGCDPPKKPEPSGELSHFAGAAAGGRDAGGCGGIPGPTRPPNLLLALKPMLRPERQGKVDRAVEMLRLMRAAKTAGQLIGKGRPCIIPILWMWGRCFGRMGRGPSAADAVTVFIAGTLKSQPQRR